MKIYYHLAMINNWEDITDFFFDSLISSGLYERCQSVTVVFVGSKIPPRNNFSGLGKVNLICGGDADAFEFPTLECLWRDSFLGEFPMLYFHTKGSSFCRERWVLQKDIYRRQYPARNYQSYSDVEIAYKCTRYWCRRVLIENFEECVSDLDCYDLVCLKHKSELRHIPSNFWWSKSSYIRSLDRPIITKDRYNAEMWVFENGVKVKPIMGRLDEYRRILI